MLRKQFITVVVFHLIFWIFSSYFIIDFFSLESEEININIDGTEIVERNHNPVLQQTLIIGIIFRMIFFYVHLLYVSAHLFINRYFTYILGAFALLGVNMIADAIATKYVAGIPWVSLWRILLPIYIFYYLASLLYSFFRRWQEIEERKSELKSQLVKAELTALRSQFDPHFVFNTLNSLLYVAEKEGNQKISTAIEDMSSLMRSIIYDFKSPTIPLSKEIELIKKYINLQLLKYDETDEITINLIIDPKIEGSDARIAPLILLPFVENAMKHGINIYKKSMVEVVLEKIDDQLTFTVRNTNHTFKYEDAKGIGLENIKKRLEILYHGNHHLSIEKGDLFTISLQLDLNHQPSQVL
jgi:two-component system LytT family sensor kinase